MHPGIQVCSMCKVDKKDEVKKHKNFNYFLKTFSFIFIVACFSRSKIKNY